MLFSRSFFLALLSAPFLVFAQNAFNVPPNFSVTAGQATNLSWTPTTPGTVTLLLRQGPSSNLQTVATIASAIPNSGSYVWTPSPSLVRGTDYAIEIVSDSDSSQVNYTPQFTLNSNTVVSSVISSSAASSAVSSAARSASSVISSASAAASSAASSAASRASSAISSASAAASSASRAASSTASAASSSAASSSSAAAKSTGAAAPRATAFAGLIGLAGLAALAL